MMMTQEELIAKIWTINCEHEMKLILLGLAIARYPAFVIDDALIDYLWGKVTFARPLIVRFIDELDAAGAFESTEPEGYVVLNLEPHVIEALEL